MSGNNGFFQLMTSVTSKIISEAYGVTNYNFQVMYMPMNTGIYHEDGFGRVIAAMLPIVFGAIVKLAGSTIKFSGDPVNEP